MTDRPIGVDGLRDLVVEAINSRDPGVLELADGIEIPDDLSDRLMEIFERHPRTMATRGDLRGRPVAAVWLPDRNERYVNLGHLEVDIEDGNARIVAVAERDPDLVPEAPAGFEVAEWESTELADSGEGRWV